VVVVGVGYDDLFHVLGLYADLFELGPYGVRPVSDAWVYYGYMFFAYCVDVATESFSYDEVDVFKCRIVFLQVEYSGQLNSRL
jgi:hypothetical protein